jgi:hypothetical protein
MSPSNKDPVENLGVNRLKLLNILMMDDSKPTQTLA